MKHKLHRFFILTSFCIFPLLAMSSELSSDLELDSYASEMMIDENAEVTLTVKGRQVTIQNAQGNYIEVYDITGKRVFYAPIDSELKQFTLKLHKGCYILRVGTVTRKVYFS